MEWSAIGDSVPLAVTAAYLTLMERVTSVVRCVRRAQGRQTRVIPATTHLCFSTSISCFQARACARLLARQAPTKKLECAKNVKVIATRARGAPQLAQVASNPKAL